jgi:hypothetical protein
MQEGTVWPLQPAYDILLQEEAPLYHVWIHIVSDVVHRRGQSGLYSPYVI